MAEPLRLSRRGREPLVAAGRTHRTKSCSVAGGQLRVADFATATALVKPATPVAEEHKTDGLSRNDEDCSRGGCIDH